MTHAPLILDRPPEARDEAAPRFTLTPDIILHAEPDGPRAEALRALRTQIMERHLKAGRRSLAVCGASAGTGISFIAANLAVAFARAGANTLLIDANLRDPAAERFIAPDRALPGLRQWLSGGDEEESLPIQGQAQPNLSVLYAGGAAPDALEMLSTARFQQLVEDAMRGFDISIIDTPPANRHADALRIAAVARHALIVARRHMSFMQDIGLLADQLRAGGARIAGTVLSGH